MLAIGVAACADDDASRPARLSGVEAAAGPEGAEEAGGAPKEAVEEAPGGEGGSPAGRVDPGEAHERPFETMTSSVPAALHFRSPCLDAAIYPCSATRKGPESGHQHS